MTKHQNSQLIWLKGFAFSALLLAGCNAPSSTSHSQESSTNSVSFASQDSAASFSVDESQPIVTFLWNYAGKENVAYYKANFVADHRLTMPSDPLRDTHLFTGWYLDAACSKAFDAKSRPTESFSLYADWITSWTFEAEYVNLDNKPGMGYSANVEGTQMIGKDNGSAKASNGYYVSYLYYNGANLEFDISASKTLTNVYFEVRLSSEFYDVALDDGNFKITVNDQDMSGFYFDLSGALPVGSDDKRPFTNFLVTSSLTLNEGTNIIKLIVNNTHSHGGTMYADAPMVDCIYLGTENTLSWNPRTDNITA